MELQKFNILVEEVTNNLITEAKHTLEDEFNDILPGVLEKVKAGFANFYKNNSPGALEIGNIISISPTDAGSQSPGFIAKYLINESYAQNKLIPILKLLSPFKEINNRTNCFTNKTKLYILIKLNAKSDDYDLSDSNISFSKYAIKRWNGKLILKIHSENLPDNNTETNIATITANIEESENLLKKIENIAGKINNKNFTIYDITDLFTKYKQNKSWKELAKGIILKCEVEFDKSLKLSKQMMKTSESAIDTSRLNLSDDFTDNTYWTVAKLDANGKLCDTGNNVTPRSNFVVGSISTSVNSNITREFNIFINLTTWKNNGMTNNNDLFQHNSNKPTFIITDRDDTTGKTLTGYPKRYTFADFKNAHRDIFDFFKYKLNQMKKLT